MKWPFAPLALACVLASLPAVPEDLQGALSSSPDGVSAAQHASPSDAPRRDRPRSQPMADRGIGGTGIAPVDQLQDRGIGGTGIVGVITGFGSIWVNGLEVELDRATRIQVGERIGTDAALRIGQRAIVEADRANGRLQARSVIIRFEVSGPIEEVGRQGTALRVAGQTVDITRAVGRKDAWKVGDWVSVSGLGRPDGTVLASRLDRRAPGHVTVRGRVEGVPGAARIGQLPLWPHDGLVVVPGQYVEVTGRYQRGVLMADTLSEDTVAADPTERFAVGTRRFSIESYASTVGRQIELASGIRIDAAPAVLRRIGTDPRRAVIEIERRPDGSLFAARTVHEMGSQAGGGRDEQSRDDDGWGHDGWGAEEGGWGADTDDGSSGYGGSPDGVDGGPDDGGDGPDGGDGSDGGADHDTE